MNIKIKSLDLKNFKGIKAFKVDFGNKTSIYGMNASGKTTLVDAFMWLLFGKDSQGNSNFNIKTLDNQGNVINGIDHSVEAILEVNGKSLKLGKTFKEKWTKKRGMSEKVFEGNTTIYEIDDVPVSLKEFKEKVDSILKENMFKLITNPSYFPNLHWTEQRKIVFDVIGNLENENVINYNEKLKPLGNLLDDNGVDHFIKKVKSQISKIKKQLVSIPERIDECNNAIIDEDFSQLEKKKQFLEEQIKVAENQIEDISKANTFLNSKRKELIRLNNEYENEKIRANQRANEPKKKLINEIEDLQYELKTNKRNIERLESKKESIRQDIESHTLERNNLRKEFDLVKSRVIEIDGEEFSCPTCGREYDEETIKNKKSDLEARFSSNKEKALEKIRVKGKNLNIDIEKLQDDMLKITNNIKEISGKSKEILESITRKQDKLGALEVAEAVVEDEDMYLNKIAELENEIKKISEGDTSRIKLEKNNLRKELEDINSKLAAKENNKRMKNRIEQLREEERELSNQVAELEGQQFLGEEFIKTKIELLESELNKKFGEVKFILFKSLLNGGMEECCEISVGGVPYKDLNNAMKINSGIKVINVLCEHYGINAPIWIDNAESVNKIADTNSQIIKLIVSEDKNLKVSLDEKAAITEEDRKFFEEKLEEIRNNTEYNSTGYIVEDLFCEAEEVKSVINETNRWSVNKSIFYEYKGLYFEVNWNDPATEMQEGQDTYLRIFEVNPIKEETINFSEVE